METELDHVKKRLAERLMICLAALALCFGAVMYAPAVASVSGKIQAKELPVYSVETEQKQVALSFDAAWSNEYTEELLAVLQEYDVKATFFITGDWAGKYPDDVKAIAAAGHDLGNHSESHPNLSLMDMPEIKAEIEAAHNIVRELTGVEMELFRPPYGSYNDSVVKAARECGYIPVQWSVDSLDWKDYGVKSIVKMVCNNRYLGNGAIILLHNGAKYTPQALSLIIEGLESQGYEIVPISQLLIRGSYHLDHTGKQIRD